MYHMPHYYSKMLKGAAKQISKPLATLFNRSLMDCCFPKSLKVANVVPIFKKGDKISITNYRPVSLLSYCGKHFERVVFKHRTLKTTFYINISPAFF